MNNRSAKSYFQEAIDALDLRNEIMNLAVHAGRELSENDLDTLKRIAYERNEMVSLLLKDTIGIPFEGPRDKYWRALEKLKLLLTMSEEW